MPRLRKGDPGEGGPAFSLAEGVTIVRRAAFEDVGGWPDAFFFGHEGIDLAWRMWDGGWELHYAADLVVAAPDDAAQPARDVLPAHRPQPGLGGAAQPAVAARPASTSRPGRC